MDENKKILLLRIASGISWFLAAFCLLSLVLLLRVVFSKDADASNITPILIALGVFFVTYSLMGWGLGRRIKWAGILAVVIAGVNTILNIISASGDLRTLIGAGISGILFVLVLLGWKVLE